MEQDYIPGDEAIKRGDRTRGRQQRTDLAPLQGRVRPRSVIVLAVFTVFGSGVTGCGCRTR
jgi:hypothetical protein